MSSRTEINIILNAVDRASGALREVADATDNLTDRLGVVKKKQKHIVKRDISAMLLN